MDPRLRVMTAQADKERVTEIARSLARGELPALADDFTWRGAACTADVLRHKLGALPQMSVTIDGVQVVRPAQTLEIAALIETFGGLSVGEGDRLAIISARFDEHLITWGLLVDAAYALRAWFDPSALLQLVAP